MSDSTPLDGIPSSPSFDITPFYQSAVNEVTEPDKMVFCSRYLVGRWLPLLGTYGFAILIYLRKRCYHNRKTGELRNTVSIPLWEIAQACAISESTVRRELQNNKALRRFVSSETDYTYDRKRGGVRQSANSYTVSMDDPVHEEDEPALQEAAKRSMMLREKGAQDPKERARQRAGVAPYHTDRASNGEGVSQNDRSVTEKGALFSQTGEAVTEAPGAVLTATPLIDYSSLPETKKNTETTPTASRDSSFPSEDGEEDAASPPVGKQEFHRGTIWYDVCRVVVAHGGDRGYAIEQLTALQAKYPADSQRWIRLLNKTRQAMDSEFGRDAKL